MKYDFVNTILQGPAEEQLKTINSDSIDLIVTDPPYGYSFMNKDWDKAVVGVETWKECLRVLKAGAFAFIMSSPRQDVLCKMILNLIDAGFETNFTSLYWTYASGFPKAADVSKLIEKRGEAKKLEGAYAGFQPKPAVELILVVMKPLSQKTFVDQALSNQKGITWLSDVRIPVSSEDDNVFAVLLKVCDSIQGSVLSTTWYNKNHIIHDHHEDDDDHILGNELHRWQASAQSYIQYPNDTLYGNSLMNASQGSQSGCPSCLRLCGELTQFAVDYDRDVFPSLSDVLSHIRRFALEHKHIQKSQYNDHLSNVHDLLRILGVLVSGDSLAYNTHTSNDTKRFPANLLVQDDVLNDGKITKSTRQLKARAGDVRFTGRLYAHCKEQKERFDKYGGYDDSGSFSRYFSLDSWTEKTLPFLIVPKPSKAEKGPNNNHPTVKSRKLMSYLITMGSRQGDIVLDPFCGSGTVLIAARQLARDFIGCEINDEYVKIANTRLKSYLLQTRLV